MSKKAPFLIFVSFCLAFALSAQTIDMNEVNGREEFRWGVTAYNRGNYNDAIRSFERALAYMPNDLTYQEWLGLALFRSGFETQAMNLWDGVVRKKADPILSSRLELQRYRQGLGRELREPGRYVLAGVVDGYTGSAGADLFRRPSSVCPVPDGGFFMAGYGNNQVFYFDINGALGFRVGGGLEGIASPYDILFSPGRNQLYISEYNGNRIIRCSLQGQINLRFGSRGRGDGEFLGPQYLAEDEKGYLYVCDFGNRRVSKFDGDGNFILAFGTPRPGFPGLREPTGIAAMDGLIYVADTKNAWIAAFDQSGNYVGRIGEGFLKAPEGLSSGDAGELIVTDDNRIYSLDLRTQAFTQLADLSGSSTRILKAVKDINGNILAVDFNNSRISFLTEVSQIYSGLVIQIDSIDSRDFPRNLVDIRVEDPQGRPVVGLTRRNFFLTELIENRYMIEDFDLVYRGNLSGTVNLALVVDRSPGMAGNQEDIRKAAGELYDSLPAQSTMRLVNSIAVPVITVPQGSSRNVLANAAAGGRQDYAAGGRLDLGIRLAAGDIVSGRGGNAVVYLCHGEPGEGAFQTYSVLDTARYLRNNGISFHVIYMNKDGRRSRDLEYICGETGGMSISYYRPEGLSGFIREIAGRPNGSYTLSYTSRADGDFGRSFIPLQAEVNLYNHTGRERSGYFSPAAY